MALFLAAFSQTDEVGMHWVWPIAYWLPLAASMAMSRARLRWWSGGLAGIALVLGGMVTLLYYLLLYLPNGLYGADPGRPFRGWPELALSVEQLRKDKVSREEELERKLRETEGLEKELLVRRGQAAKVLNPRLLAHYERIRDAKDGRGIATLVGEACGGCFALIPPQTQVIIKQSRDIYACEACGRFIAPDSVIN